MNKSIHVQKNETKKMNFMFKLYEDYMQLRLTEVEFNPGLSDTTIL